MESFAHQTVRDISALHPQTYKVFQKHGINFCCGGTKPLALACAENNVPLEHVVAELEAVCQTSPDTENWAEKSQSELMDHLVATHHAYLYDELPRLSQLAERVANRHGDRDPHLPELRDLVLKIGSDLLSHMEKEETTLFPVIREQEAHTLKHGFAHKTPLQVAAFEHKLTNHDLDHLVELTENFAIKPNMCGSYQALYHGLKELNDTVRLQIHKENSILFARMAEL